MQAADEWRGTTVQVCGLWPFAAGTGSPMVGVPIGRNLLSGATLCADPISWFQCAHLISTPSMFVLGKVGLGKSSLVRRMALGLTGYGVLPMVLGDLKPDYVDLIRALGGQVIELGRGRRDAQRNLQRLRRRCRCEWSRSCGRCQPRATDSRSRHGAEASSEGCSVADGR